MKNQIKNEGIFAKTLGEALSPNLSDEEKKVIDIRYGLDYGGIVNFANAYLRRLVKAIKKGRMTLEGFEQSHAVMFSAILNSERLDSELQSELSHLLYGADERARYLQ